ncbi:MAG: DUF2249 domain-containing protein [Sulfuricellaceae bacterium]|nr:DUF2249 domain-containing protein [Sulfuricellaceae bacterium]
MSEHLVDARWLEPPEPLELALAAIETLSADDQVRLLIHRDPCLLYPILTEWGYEHETRFTDDGTYEVRIWKTPP